MYQFIHIDVYAETVSTKAVDRRTKTNSKGKRNGGTKSLLNVHKVIAEAKREEDSCPHVAFPRPPIKIYGIDLDEVERLAIASKVSQTDSKGRKLRTDTPILLAGISSYPRDEYELAPEKFEIWLDDTVNWLKSQYGDHLKNITLHQDEEHPHIHFYAVSPDGRAKYLHAGYQAESLVDIKDSKARSLAYKEGMRQFQDRYYEDVSVKNGMLRDGPQRLRKSRAIHQAEKANAKLLSAKIREIDEVDQLVAASLEQTYHETIEQAKQESARYAKSLMAETIKAVTAKSNSMLETAKLQVEKMFENARHEADLMRDEVMKWSKNTRENIRKLADAEAKVQSLTVEIKVTREQLDYFVAENQELKRTLIAPIHKSN
jgi:hypothetical protein